MKTFGFVYVRINSSSAAKNKLSKMNRFTCNACIMNKLNWKTRYYSRYSTASKHRAWNLKFNANGEWTCFSHCICVFLCAEATKIYLNYNIFRWIETISEWHRQRKRQRRKENERDKLGLDDNCIHLPNRNSVDWFGRALNL